MIIRISNVNDRFCTKVEVDVPKGIHVVPKEFDSYISLAISNAVTSILYYEENWNFYSTDSATIIIDIENYTVYSVLAKDETLDLLDEYKDSKSFVLASFRYPA